jgi:hypothetical protein
VKKTAELTTRRNLLIARIEAERETLGCYVERLQRPAHLLETSWRVTKFVRSPVVATALSLLLSRTRQHTKGKGPRLPWYLQQGWRLFTTLKQFGK